ncbi:uncharacterized protein [Onthophagus taurus]|uniref:uncharacterized protein n=1 Tax=Onthophagus taurus TaxID=166361 RepID=UPI0039BE8752
MNASDKNEDFEVRLYKFLFAYRNTIHASTKRTSSELLLAKRPRNQFDTLKPDVTINMEAAQERQINYYDKYTHEKDFETEEPVWVDNPITKGSTAGTIIEKRGPYSYIVDVNGTRKRKHADQLRQRIVVDDEIPRVPSPRIDPPHFEPIETPPEVSEPTTVYDSPPQMQTPEIVNVEPTVEDNHLTPPPEDEVFRRNPPRNRQLPARYRN